MSRVDVDLHVKILNESVIERARARGLDAIVYAPHFQRLPAIRARARRYATEDVQVIPGREIFTGSWRNRGHVLAVGLERPVPDFIDLETAMAEFDRQNAAVLVPHPTFLTVSLDADDIRRYSDVIDAIEAYNPKHWPHHNRRAQTLADELDLPAFSSSYAHLRGTVGEAWTTFDREIDETADLVSALQSGTGYSPAHREGMTHRRRCLAEFTHLGWENTWKKFDRLVLSGQEPTHPHHPSYDGKFEDASVY